MANKCACVPCENSVVTRIKNKLSWQQRDMLGYFCGSCILAKCDFRHKVKS